MTTDTSAVWRGRLGGLDPRARELNDSLPVDGRLWPEELQLTRAYARSLVECGVMRSDEAVELDAACAAIEAELSNGTLTLAGEDVHSAIEAELTKRCGDPGRKIHTGRSRNDQVGTLLRMRSMRLCDDAIEGVRELERALLHQARAAETLAVASYTHLQPAQPVLLAHWWLAHVTALERDEQRFESAREAAGVLPLGSGAVAGTPLRYDRGALATRLGFTRLASNSMDAVGDRDFALDYLNAAAALGLHLSRLAEDLVLWCSPAFGWYAAPEGFATGSSLLPQKRNPDVFELTRGKSARLVANAGRLALLLKGLPSSYQKDLQEDKEAVFDTSDTLDALLAALAPAIRALEVNAASAAKSLTPDLLAVELADALVETGVPFRDAHAAVGRLWAAAEQAGITPAALATADRLAISPHFTDDRLAALSVESALARRSHAPGAGPVSVAQQLARHEARLGLAAGDPEGTDSFPRIPGTDGISPGALPQAERSPGMGGAGRGRGGSRQDGETTPYAPGETPAVPGTPPTRTDGITLRRARLEDVPGIAGVMADYVIEGTLLPRPVSELFQCIREFHIAESDGRIVACAALRVLWEDLGEVRSLAVAPDHHGRGLGAELVTRVVEDARAIGLPRIIALTRTVGFFERSGFTVEQRETLPRKVWTDCVRCPRRHACDETAVVLDLVPGASAAARTSGRSWVLPIPPPAVPETSLPIIVS